MSFCSKGLFKMFGLRFKNFMLVALLIMPLALSACATSSAGAKYSSKEMADPIEPVNRAIFGFNEFLDKILIEPVAKLYKAVIPSPVRDSVRNVVRNLEAPVTLANNVLQGDMAAAKITVSRFAINSTIGMCGLFDVAEPMGYKYREEDFGQTLAKWGAGEGFYLVLPVLGPSSLRDATGLAADTYADPTRIIASNTDNDWIYYTKSGLSGVDTRARLIKSIDDLRRSSLDYYATVRSAYSQRRVALINNEDTQQTKGETKASNAYEDLDR